MIWATIGIVVTAPMIKSVQPTARRWSSFNRSATSNPTPAPRAARVPPIKAISGMDKGVRFIGCSSIRFQGQLPEIVLVEFLVRVGHLVQCEGARHMHVERTGLDQVIEPLNRLWACFHVVSLDRHAR